NYGASRSTPGWAWHFPIWWLFSSFLLRQRRFIPPELQTFKLPRKPQRLWSRWRATSLSCCLRWELLERDFWPFRYWQARRLTRLRKHSDGAQAWKANH